MTSRNTLLIVICAVASVVPVWVYRSEGELERCQSNVLQIGGAVSLYSTDHRGAYPPMISDLVPDYLGEIPRCPTSGLDTYSLTYRVAPLEDNEKLSYGFVEAPAGVQAFKLMCAHHKGQAFIGK